MNNSWKTREVIIGNIVLGGNNPVRLQSMATTNTKDTKTTVEQCIRIINAGAELVRITAPGIKDAENLKNIKDVLRKSGYNTPIVADIHYSKSAGEKAAELVEKVRINPGNYIDKKNFQQIEYTTEEYKDELQKIEDNLLPLLKICKKHKTAVRIGVNHGSLSDRIMSKYGDTPEGMVESALEFLRICIIHNFYDIVISMKASNPAIMVYATRLLVIKMTEEGMNFPIHLGVTEAGEGEDGRIKSAIGIGALLWEGIGDTIRVSLTEEPEFEIPVAKKIVEHIELNKPKTKKLPVILDYKKRNSKNINDIGENNPPIVVADLSDKQQLSWNDLEKIGWLYNKHTKTWDFNDTSADYLFIDNTNDDIFFPDEKGIIIPYNYWKDFKKGHELCFPLFNNIDEFRASEKKSSALNFISIKSYSDVINGISDDLHATFVCELNNIYEYKELFDILNSNNISTPVIFKRTYKNIAVEELTIKAACDIGPLFIDGFGDGIWINTPEICSTPVAFGILQATRTRITKPDYISCPGCGRTLFNLQNTSAKIRERTAHLKGLKIGIMGCIVNGPGEMADADYGYVGTGIGKITLYKNKEVVKRNIPENQAVDELVNLIKENGDWLDIES